MATAIEKGDYAVRVQKSEFRNDQYNVYDWDSHAMLGFVRKEDGWWWPYVGGERINFWERTRADAAISVAINA